MSDLKNRKIYFKVHIQGFSNIIEQTQTLLNIFILTVGPVLGSAVSSSMLRTPPGTVGKSGILGDIENLRNIIILKKIKRTISVKRKKNQQKKYFIYFYNFP